jgi:hypothetical protein
MGRLAARSERVFVHRQFQRPKVARQGKFMERPVAERVHQILTPLDIPHLDDGRGDTEKDDAEDADELRVVEGPAAEVVEMIREFRNLLRRGRVDNPLTHSFRDTGS